LSQDHTVAEPLTTAESAAADGVRSRSEPFDLEEINEPWAEALRQANPTQFQHGGRRVAAPLVSGNQWLGVAILADRVSGVPYTVEEFELLKCIGDQLTASLLKVRLTGEIMRARELEAFQTVSAFFVHDLKNATSSLNLTLRNLPVHFDDPAFRQDALRAIASTVERINSLTSKLTVLRGKLELSPVELDLNQLVNDTIADSNALMGMSIQTDFRPVPRITADRERLQSVLTNLLFNARDAVATGGQVTVQTHVSDGHAILSVHDTGCGMSGDFVRRQLFRPFQTTKKQGIGIGMFQTKAIVDAHGGTVQVESTLGKGSTFRVALPITSRAA
jgi:putative PEP-CTERM system histidine kinase